MEGATTAVATTCARLHLQQSYLRRHLRRHALIRSSLSPRPVSRGWSAHPQKLLLQLMRPFHAKHGANLMLTTMEGATTAVATTCARLHLQQSYLRRHLRRHALIRSSLTPRLVSRGWSAHPQKLLLQLMRPFHAKHGANLMLTTMEGGTAALATTRARLHLQQNHLRRHALIRSSLTPRPVSRGWSAHPQKLLLQLMRPFR